MTNSSRVADLAGFRADAVEDEVVGRTVGVIRGGLYTPLLGALPDGP